MYKRGTFEHIDMVAPVKYRDYIYKQFCNLMHSYDKNLSFASRVRHRDNSHSNIAVSTTLHLYLPHDMFQSLPIIINVNKPEIRIEY